MQEERKKIIQHALGFDINDVHTYAGYKGDLIVKITTKTKETALTIRKFANSLDIEEVVVKINPATQEYEIYCVTSDENVYHLKADDENEGRDHSNYVEDKWSNHTID